MRYGKLQWAGTTTLYVSSGAISANQSIHLVDTEAAAATDDLVTINGYDTGQVLLIRSANSARTVVIKETGNISCGGSDVTLDNTDKYIIFLYDAALSKWVIAGGAAAFPFTRGGTLVNTADFLSAINICVWYATSACRVTAVRGWRVGGDTTTSINARKAGTDNHLATAKTLASESTWIDGGAVQNTDYTVGQSLEVMVVSAGPSATQIAIQVDFVKL
jgi:hypothetical protein